MPRKTKQQQIEELQAKLAANEAKLDAVHGQLATAKDEIGLLEQKNRESGIENAGLSSQIKGLEGCLEEVKASSEREASDLRRQIRGLEGEISGALKMAREIFSLTLD